MRAGIKSVSPSNLKIVVAIKDKDINKLIDLVSTYNLASFKQVKFSLEDYFMQFYREEKDFGGVKWKKN